MQPPSERTQFGTVQEPSAAPINPERIHDASALKVLIVVLMLVAALAIGWIVENHRTPAAAEPAPSQGVTVTTGQGVTVTTGPQQPAKKTGRTSKPVRKSAEKQPQ